MEPIGKGRSGVIPCAAADRGIAEFVSTVVDLNAADASGIVGAREVEGVVFGKTTTGDRGR